MKAQEKPLSHYLQDEVTSCELYVTEQRANSYKQNTIDEGQELKSSSVYTSLRISHVKNKLTTASLLFAIILHLL